VAGTLFFQGEILHGIGEIERQVKKKRAAKPAAGGRRSSLGFGPEEQRRFASGEGERPPIDFEVPRRRIPKKRIRRTDPTGYRWP